MKKLSNLEKLECDLFKNKEVSFFVKRDDEIHPTVSGNKYRKLLYLIKHLKSKNVKKIITFGGAYSNHIHASSYAFRENGIRSIGIIRGEELKNKKRNSTLSFAEKNGMELIFVTREEYKKRNNPEYINYLSEKYNAFIVPEGGTSCFAKQGLIDMVDEVNNDIVVDYFACATGSAGTVAGINAGLLKNQTVLSFPVVKNISGDVKKTIKSFSKKNQYRVIEGYEFGGYGKYSDELIKFIDWFEKKFKIEIEQVYTGKVLFALFDMIKKNYFNGKRVCFVHTGGLQGKLKNNLKNIDDFLFCC